MLYLEACATISHVTQELYSLLTHSFLATGQFFAPKLIILNTGLIDILFFKVLF